MSVHATKRPNEDVINVSGVTLAVTLAEAVELVGQLAAIIDQATAEPTPEHEGYAIGGRQPQGDDGSAEAAHARLVEAIARKLEAERGKPPHGADRWAVPGETCTCGAPAVVVYQGPGHAPVGFCGRNRI